ncbi:hypothetical protein DL1_11420 [Thioclava dalianensis]|uniref:Phage tail protein n=1 Tax=Thioclava dalianensis TaxID=1185766 RepID=A0A074THL4_9RHOB|nr:hypothetical protein [Thioclava dalianensis]KEP68528.1 hypothetical protein DL1_11420 [Thioclava dalianensis]SFN83989.1 hypothetical protein SAMN05216224_11714 [Thioclava dalianensis]
MAIYATNGAKLFIGGSMTVDGDDLTVTDFDGETWVEVGETENLGKFGDTSNEITFAGLASGRQRRLKGVRDAGTMEVICGIDYADPGQLALISAEKTIFDYAFKVVLNDAPEGGTPSERYFAAAVGSASEALDTADNVMKLNSTLWINSNVVRVNAAEA